MRIRWAGGELMVAGTLALALAGGCSDWKKKTVAPAESSESVEAATPSGDPATPAAAEGAPKPAETAVEAIAESIPAPTDAATLIAQARDVHDLMEPPLLDNVRLTFERESNGPDGFGGTLEIMGPRLRLAREHGLETLTYLVTPKHCQVSRPPVVLPCRPEVRKLWEAWRPYLHAVEFRGLKAEGAEFIENLGITDYTVAQKIRAERVAAINAGEEPPLMLAAPMYNVFGLHSGEMLYGFGKESRRLEMVAEFMTDAEIEAEERDPMTARFLEQKEFGGRLLPLRGRVNVLEGPHQLFLLKGVEPDVVTMERYAPIPQARDGALYAQVWVTPFMGWSRMVGTEAEAWARVDALLKFGKARGFDHDPWGGVTVSRWHEEGAAPADRQWLILAALDLKGPLPEPMNEGDMNIGVMGEVTIRGVVHHGERASAWERVAVVEDFIAARKETRLPESWPGITVFGYQGPADKQTTIVTLPVFPVTE